MTGVAMMGLLVPIAEAPARDAQIFRVGRGKVSCQALREDRDLLLTTQVPISFILAAAL